MPPTQLHKANKEIHQHAALVGRDQATAGLVLCHAAVSCVVATVALVGLGAAVQLAVREELARTQEIAVKLDAMARLAEDEAAQLRVQYSAQEDDRQHLVR